MTDFRFIALLAVLSGLSACGSTPVEDRYYSLVLAADEAGSADAGERGVALLVVGPVILPDYLQKRGIALQTGGSSIQTANHHFWAEPLDEAIAKVLVRDLARLTEAIAVDRDAGRWTGTPDCRVRIEFDKFHATGDSRVVSSGRYWISSAGETVRQEFAVSQTLSADGYAHAVEALRESLDTVAAQISGHLTSRSICTG